MFYTLTHKESLFITLLIVLHLLKTDNFLIAIPFLVCHLRQFIGQYYFSSSLESFVLVVTALHLPPGHREQNDFEIVQGQDWVQFSLVWPHRGLPQMQPQLSLHHFLLLSLHLTSSLTRDKLLWEDWREIAVQKSSGSNRILFSHVSRPGRSQGLLYKHLRHSLTD